MPNYVGQDMADGVYARRPWNQYLEGNAYGETPGFAANDPAVGPDARVPEMIVSERLEQHLSAQPQPPARQMWRPRYGYDRGALGIEDVLDIDSIYRIPQVPMDANPGGSGEINSTNVYSSYGDTLGKT